MPIESTGHFRNLVAQSTPGSRLPVTVYREGRELQLEIIVGERPHVQALNASIGHEVERLGLDLTNLNFGMAKRLGLPLSTQGVVVIEVLPGSPAEMAGLQSGDVIREVNRKPISSASDFEANLGNRLGIPLVLLVNREGNDLYVVLEQRQE
jgi:serine protease Do